MRCSRLIYCAPLFWTFAGACSSPASSTSTSAVSALSSGGAIVGIGGKCLDVRSAGTANGTQVQLYTCNQTGAQQWTRSGQTFVGLAGKCLDASGGSSADKTKVQLWDCNGTSAQVWTISGQYLVSGGGKCLNIASDVSADSTPAELYDCNGAASELWTVQDAPTPAPTTMPTPAPTTPPPSTGISPVDMTGWTLAFEDTFSGTSLDTSKWREYGTAPSGSPPIYFNNDGISVDNGFTGTIWSQDGQWYGPGLQTYAGWTYYRSEIRAQIPKGDGVGPYFLMWPENNDWPPEFDLVETPGGTDQVMTTWHWPGANNANESVSTFYPVDRTQWHVYTLEHTTAGFKFWIDGDAQPVPAAWAENNDTHVMNFGIGAVAFPAGSSWYGGTDSTTPDPYKFFVSYVRMWTEN